MNVPIVIAVVSVVLAAAAALLLRRSRGRSDGSLRQRRVVSSQQRQERHRQQTDAELVRHLEQEPVLAQAGAAGLDARQEIVTFVAGRRSQAALSRWPEVRGLFVPHVAEGDLDAIEDLLSVLAERAAEEDYARQTDARLVDLMRSHPYFSSFPRRSPPGVRRFFEKFNAGRYTEILNEWDGILAGMWADEGDDGKRRYVPYAPEIRAAIRTLALRRTTG